jgi:hypothetical protein
MQTVDEREELRVFFRRFLHSLAVQEHLYKLPFFISSTAKLAARAVMAINVRVGF